MRGDNRIKSDKKKPFLMFRIDLVGGMVQWINHHDSEGKLEFSHKNLVKGTR
jgi:hypothetical protein